MAIFDRLRGKKQEAEEPSALTDAAAAASVSPTLDLTEQATPQQSDAAAKILGFNKQEAGRLYNPYEGEHNNHNLAINYFPTKPSFIFFA